MPALRAAVTDDFELVEDTVLLGADGFIALRQPDGSWKVDRYQSNPMSIGGPMAGPDRDFPSAGAKHRDCG